MIISCFFKSNLLYGCTVLQIWKNSTIILALLPVPQTFLKKISSLSPLEKKSQNQFGLVGIKIHMCLLMKYLWCSGVLEIRKKRFLN